MSSPSLNVRINDHRSLIDSSLIDKDDLKKYELDTLIQIAGGFGRLQWFLMIYSIVASQGFNYFMYNFAYLELVPNILWKYNQMINLCSAKTIKIYELTVRCISGKLTMKISIVSITGSPSKICTVRVTFWLGSLDADFS